MLHCDTSCIMHHAFGPLHRVLTQQKESYFFGYSVSAPLNNRSILKEVWIQILFEAQGVFFILSVLNNVTVCCLKNVMPGF